jgi:hypothetical protein
VAVGAIGHLRRCGRKQARLRPGDSLQRRYIASWVEHKTSDGWGAASSWVPTAFESAKATLIAELQHNLGKWADIGGSDPARYSDALEVLMAATGPVIIDLPGHVLSITETPGRGR